MIDRSPDRLDELIEMVQERRPGRSISADTPLGEDGLGFDSVGLVELIFECEDRFGVSVDAERLLEAPGAPTLGTLASWIGHAAG